MQSGLCGHGEPGAHTSPAIEEKVLFRGEEEVKGGAVTTTEPTELFV